MLIMESISQTLCYVPALFSPQICVWLPSAPLCIWISRKWKANPSSWIYFTSFLLSFCHFITYPVKLTSSLCLFAGECPSPQNWCENLCVGLTEHPLAFKRHIVDMQCRCLCLVHNEPSHFNQTLICFSVLAWWYSSLDMDQEVSR